MRRTIITLAVGIGIGAAAVAAPALGSHHAGNRDITLRTGDYVIIPTLDLECQISRHDPDRHLTGPIIFCDRYSESGHSWSVTISRRWIQVFNAPGYRVWQHARLP
jgi:hypothetical protein